MPFSYDTHPYVKLSFIGREDRLHKILHVIFGREGQGHQSSVTVALTDGTSSGARAGRPTSRNGYIQKAGAAKKQNEELTRSNK
ncbi:hypothetical protein BaRGS_00000543 [Batillaria attramentaria]|uniref:Uncharacterized protein n=1 Tax=Batillaria attramentaria TaxID=370345 RepID=A0ABD0M911_9CAEN